MKPTETPPRNRNGPTTRFRLTKIEALCRLAITTGLTNWDCGFVRYKLKSFQKRQMLLGEGEDVDRGQLKTETDKGSGSITLCYQE